MVAEIVTDKGVSILGWDNIVSNLSSFRSVLTIVRLETVVILEVTFSTNWLLGDLLVVVAVELGLPGLELRVGLVAAHRIMGVSGIRGELGVYWGRFLTRRTCSRRSQQRLN